jgi:hypothetical protein
MHINLSKNAHHRHTGIHWPFSPERLLPDSRGAQFPTNYLSDFIFCRYRCFLHLGKQRKTAKKEWAL